MNHNKEIGMFQTTIIKEKAFLNNRKKSSDTLE
jgi:hypothetical protein